MHLHRTLSDTQPRLERSKQYRYQADELRTIADEWMDAGTRELLKGIASNYEHMAEQLERQVRPGNALA